MVVYVDFACPYSYAMSERLRSLEHGADGGLDWRLVEHAPDAAVPMGGEASPRELEEVRRAAPEIELRQPPGLPNSGLASEVYAGLPAERRAGFRHAVFRALWVAGRDISAPEVLEELAGGELRPDASRAAGWQADWVGLGTGVPCLIREDGARCLGIVEAAALQEFLAGRGGGLEGIY